MSAELLGIAFKADIRPHAFKLVALKLVDAGRDDGTKIFPAVATIAKAAGVSERHTKRVLHAFVEIGLLEVVEAGGKGRGDTTEYRLDTALLARLGTTARMTFKNGRGTLSAKGDTASPSAKRVTPEPVKGDTSVTQPLRDPLSLREGAHAREGRALAIAPVLDEGSIDEALIAMTGIWPAGAVGDTAKARALLADMSEGERKAAREAAPRYLRALQAEKRRYTPAIATYLANRDFERFPEPTGADAPVPMSELKPYSRELWLLLWSAVAEAVKGGEERHFNRVKDRLGQLTRGLVTPIAAVPAGEELIAMVPIVVGSAEHAAWATYAERLGVILPRPDVAEVIFVPAKAPPVLRRGAGWKAYGLAKPVTCFYRDRTWWWRLFQIEDGKLINDQLTDGASHRGSTPAIYFGPWPAAADLASMVEIRQGSDQWSAWEKWFDAKGIWLRWPDPSIWCPSDYPPEGDGAGGDRESGRVGITDLSEVARAFRYCEGHPRRSHRARLKGVSA